MLLVREMQCSASHREGEVGDAASASFARGPMRGHANAALYVRRNTRGPVRGMCGLARGPVPECADAVAQLTRCCGSRLLHGEQPLLLSQRHRGADW